MRLAFIWQGFDGRYGHWRDGLWAAMQLLEKEHEVKYFDFPLKDIDEFNPDVVLYWEAPSTILGKDRDNYLSVCFLPYKKCLLFAGGPIKREWLTPFDLVFVESRINEEELDSLGIKWKRAFGVNTQLMKPLNLQKKHDGFMHATFAGWKRHELFADALQSKGVVAGRKQDHDWNGYDRCVKQGVTILPEQPAEEIAKLINQSYCVVNTSEYWGGGQRCTLEAMACGVPVLVMDDSPKNCEYVEESGGGAIVKPDPEQIRLRLEYIKLHPELGTHGFDYVKRYWTEQHYATALLGGIYSIL